jgi:DNA-binding cell septation regulator SpoVG
MTRFVILAQIPKTDDRPSAWGEIARIDAASKEQALRSIGGTSGLYVAVPERQWKPMRLEVQTVERVKLTSPEETT